VNILAGAQPEIATLRTHLVNFHPHVNAFVCEAAARVGPPMAVQRRPAHRRERQVRDALRSISDEGRL
jgi:hypothetical protein